MTLGQRIRAARKSAGMNQTQLAALVGVQQCAISAWERDSVADGPRLTQGLKICDACGVGLLWLATGMGVGPTGEQVAA